MRLGSLQAVASGGASIISSATAPTSPNGGGVSETLVIGLLVGLAIALSLVFLLESLDRRVKTIASSSGATGFPRSSRSPSRARAIYRQRARSC